jgi:hypothetical protein
MLVIFRGWLTGKVTKSGAPEGSRIQHYETNKQQRPPMFRDFASEEKTWKIIDTLKAVAGETGTQYAKMTGYIRFMPFPLSPSILHPSIHWYLHTILTYWNIGVPLQIIRHDNFLLSS